MRRALLEVLIVTVVVIAAAAMVSGVLNALVSIADARVKAGPNVAGAHHRLKTPGGALDGVVLTAPSAAYSLRQLKSTYSGPAIRVRRASDNAEQDINFLGFVPGLGAPLDVAAANAFCNATTCFFRTWYDQSGNARDVVQATAANQPALIFNCNGTKPCARQTVAVQTLATAAAVVWAAARTTLSFVGQRTAGPTVRCYYVGRNGGWFASETSAGLYVLSDFSTEFTAAATEGAWHAGLGVIDGAASVIRVDGTETTGNVAGAAGTQNAFVFPFGGVSTCNITEAIIWDGYALTAGERASLVANQRAYWGF